MEEVKSADLSAVANLTRAAFAQQRWAAELKTRAEQHRSKPENGTPNEPPQIPPNAQPAVASPQQQVTGAARPLRRSAGTARPPLITPAAAVTSLSSGRTVAGFLRRLARRERTSR